MFVPVPPLGAPRSRSAPIRLRQCSLAALTKKPSHISKPQLHFLGRVYLVLTLRRYLVLNGVILSAILFEGLGRENWLLLGDQRTHGVILDSTNEGISAALMPLERVDAE